jgi:hypothetical protein
MTKTTWKLSMKLFLTILVLLNWSTVCHSKSIKLGGSDTGGGSGLYYNDKLILKDFQSCTGLKTLTKSWDIKEEIISNSISKLDSSMISEALTEIVIFNEPIEKAFFQMAINRTAIYLIYANLDRLDNNFEQLAIFKRPLGILINKNLFLKLDNTQKFGLLFHEALRMISIGLEIPIENQNLEKLTCTAFSKEINLEDYQELNNFITQWKESQNVYDNSPIDESQILSDLENARDLNDISFPFLSTSSKYFLFQTETSKFENLRNIIPSSSTENLDSAFYEWASKESPTACRGKAQCHFNETWPIYADKIMSPLQIWDLIENSPSLTVWVNENSEFVFINKEKHDSNFCQKIIYSTHKHLNLKLDSNVSGIEFLINRTNLDYFSFIYKENAKLDFCTMTKDQSSSP